MSSENEDLDDKDKDKVIEEEKEKINPLNISDDDFDDVVFTDLENTTKKELDKDEDKDKEKKEDIADKTTSEDLSKDDSKQLSDNNKKDDENLEIDTLNTEKVDNKKESKNSNDEQENEQKLDKEKENSSLNFEEEHKKLLAPFRANNKNIQVDSVEEARTLMQMGVNYNKKMAGLKPNLKIVKMLENNDLLDEEKISYLIDLDKKDPEAVKKFIKESGIDPLELDLKAKSSYKPNNAYTVDDKEVELDGILDEIKDTKSFNYTIDIIGNKWDESSKKVLRDNPSIIKVINDHVTAGIYEKIDTVITKERALGNLDGLSDIEAYKQVGDAINAQGGFDTTQSNSADTIKDKSDSSDNTKQKKTEDPKLRERKKSASSTKGKSAEKTNKDFNPLSLSDEEFDKVSAGKFL